MRILSRHRSGYRILRNVATSRCRYSAAFANSIRPCVAIFYSPRFLRIFVFWFRNYRRRTHVGNVWIDWRHILQEHALRADCEKRSVVRHRAADSYPFFFCQHVAFPAKRFSAGHSIFGFSEVAHPVKRRRIAPERTFSS